MSVERFEKKAGSPALQSLDDPGLVAVGDPSAVRWVRVPDSVRGLGGQRISVERVESCGCPACEHGRGTAAPLRVDATRYVLAPTPVPGREGKVLGVVECPAHGFLWLAVDP